MHHSDCWLLRVETTHIAAGSVGRIIKRREIFLGEEVDVGHCGSRKQRRRDMNGMLATVPTGQWHWQGHGMLLDWFSNAGTGGIG